jgi:hypothetical protein
MESIIVDELYEFDRTLFGTDEVLDPQINAYALEAAKQIALNF